MVNRSIEQKRLKMKRRGRYAVFSGATTKYVSRTETVLEHDGEDKVRLKSIEVLVGNVSLSKQVMSTGRGPDAERMQAYYARVSAESYSTTLAEDLGIKDSRYQQVWSDTPKENKVNLEDNTIRRVDLFFCEKNWFFIEIDRRINIIRRSRVYGSRAFAMGRYHYRMIVWVEEIKLSPT